MSVMVRTDDLPAGARSECFHEVVGAAVGQLDVREGDGNALPDQVRAADLGAVRVGELSASRPGGADRTRRHIQAMDADLCKVDVVAQGEFVIEQDGRQARLHAGDFTFVDLSRPAHWTNGWSSRIVAIAFPRRLLPVRADDVAGLTAVGLPGDHGAGALFSSTARQVARQLDHLDPAAGPGWAPPRSTCSRSRSPAASSGKASCRRTSPSGRCCCACAPSSRPGSPTPSSRPRPWPAPTTSRSAPCTSCSRGSR